eukprot:scaffold21118_cov112-Isochrysis_galbana.AAC.3
MLGIAMIGATARTTAGAAIGVHLNAAAGATNSRTRANVRMAGARHGVRSNTAGGRGPCTYVPVGRSGVSAPPTRYEMYRASESRWRKHILL